MEPVEKDSNSLDSKTKGSEKRRMKTSCCDQRCLPDCLDRCLEYWMLNFHWTMNQAMAKISKVFESQVSMDHWMRQKETHRSTALMVLPFPDWSTLDAALRYLKPMAKPMHRLAIIVVEQMDSMESMDSTCWAMNYRNLPRRTVSKGHSESEDPTSRRSDCSPMKHSVLEANFGDCSDDEEYD